ncbi:hypothetical protein D3C76_1281730 [compost metagenome]
MHAADGVDQRFLDRVVAVQRCRRADRQRGVDPHRGVQGTEHRLEQLAAQRLEQRLVGQAQGFVPHPLGLFEQREIAERPPQRPAGAIAQQQAAARVTGVQVWPVVEAGVEVGVRHRASLWQGRQSPATLACNRSVISVGDYAGFAVNQRKAENVQRYWTCVLPGAVADGGACRGRAGR